MRLLALALAASVLALSAAPAEARFHSCRSADLRYFGHWITPPGGPRRYTTRFFVAPLPDGQTPSHDEGEAVDHEWVRPADALDRFAAGEWDLILPTERSLHALAGFRTVAEALAHADGLPPLVDDHGGRRLSLPATQELTP